MPKPWRSKAYRDAGKGEPCTFLCGRITVDAAHVRLKGFCGTGQKPSDVMIVDSCRPCHLEYGDMNQDELAPYVLAAMCRTLERRMAMLEDGRLEI